MTPRIALIGDSLRAHQRSAAGLHAIVMTFPALPLGAEELRLFDIVVLGDEALCALDAGETVAAADDAGAVVWVCQGRTPLTFLIPWLGCGVVTVPPEQLEQALRDAGSGPVLVPGVAFEPASLSASTSQSAA